MAKTLFLKEHQAIESLLYCSVWLKLEVTNVKNSNLHQNIIILGVSLSSNIFARQFYLYFLCCTLYILVQNDVKVIEVNFDLNLRTFRKKYLLSTNIF
jgi:hypothetical protein